MPTFHTARPRGIANSVRALLSSSPNLSEAQLMALGEHQDRADRSTALAEKARLEVEQLRDAARMRADPQRANEYAGVVSGLPGGDVPRRLGGYVRGETIPPTFPMDDEGNPMPAASYARPDVTPEQEETFRSAIGSLIANQLATGSTNAEQLTGAGTNLLTQQAKKLSLENLAGQREAKTEVTRTPVPRPVPGRTQAQEARDRAYAARQGEATARERAENARKAQETVKSRFRNDRTMKGKKLGNWVEKKGFEVLDGDKVIGFYD